jgi:hypothetical protein
MCNGLLLVKRSVAHRLGRAPRKPIGRQRSKRVSLFAALAALPALSYGGGLRQRDWFRRDQAETRERGTRVHRHANRGGARTRACALHAQRRRDGQNPATGHAERFAAPGVTGHRTEAHAESLQVIGSTGLRQAPAVRALVAQSHARAALVARAPARLTRSTPQYTSSRWPPGLTGAYNIIMFWLNVQPHTAPLASDIDRRRGAAKCFLLWCYKGCRKRGF